MCRVQYYCPRFRHPLGKSWNISLVGELQYWCCVVAVFLGGGDSFIRSHHYCRLSIFFFLVLLTGYFQLSYLSHHSSLLDIVEAAFEFLSSRI